MESRFQKCYSCYDVTNCPVNPDSKSQFPVMLLPLSNRDASSVPPSVSEPKHKSGKPKYQQ
jgi:hypothetical protein